MRATDAREVFLSRAREQQIRSRWRMKRMSGATVALCWNCDRVRQAQRGAQPLRKFIDSHIVAEWRSTKKRLIPDRGLPEPACSDVSSGGAQRPHATRRQPNVRRSLL